MKTQTRSNQKTLYKPNEKVFDFMTMNEETLDKIEYLDQKIRAIEKNLADLNKE